jgi:predicted DsbA family dithiol-disulfide isomerase
MEARPATRGQGSAAVVALASGEDVGVRADEALSHFGIHAVPTFVFDSQDAVSGVVPSRNWPDTRTDLAGCLTQGVEPDN